MEIEDKIKKIIQETSGYTSEDSSAAWNEFAKLNGIETNSTSSKDRSTRTKGINKRLPSNGLLYVIIAVLFILGSILLFNLFSPKSTLPPSNPIRVETIEHSDTFKLPDGSIAILEPGSSIEYVQGEESRNSKLTGSGSFNVAHDPEHPFIVDFYKVQIKALGTIFHLDVDADTLLIHLFEGSIEITNVAKNKKQILKPGELQRIYHDSFLALETYTDDTNEDESNAVIDTIHAYFDQPPLNTKSQKIKTSTLNSTKTTSNYRTSDVIKLVTARSRGKIKFSRRIRFKKNDTITINLNQDADLILKDLINKKQLKQSPGKCKDCIVVSKN